MSPCDPTHYGPQAEPAGVRLSSFITFQTECGAGDTFDPSVTLAAGCPTTPHWDLGDGTVMTGTSISYAGYADAGPHTVTLTLRKIETYLTGINVNDDKITGDFLGALASCAALQTITTGDNTNLASDLSSLTGLTNLTTLDLREHQWLMTGDIADLAGLTNLTYIYAAGTGIHGDIGDLAGMTQLTYLDIHSNIANGGITGDLADIDTLTNLTYLALGNTYVTGDLADLAPLVNMSVLMLYSSGGPGTGLFTGDLADLAPMTNLAMFFGGMVPGYYGSFSVHAKLWFAELGNMTWNQAQIDGLLAALYTNRATFTTADPHMLLIGGSTNATPGGVYADEDPPATGLGYVYELCNDPEAEGFKTWTIQYWGGAGNVTRP